MDHDALDLVGDIYDCAIDPGRWPPTLKRIADYAGGDHAGITVDEPLKREMRWGAAWGLDPDTQRRYEEQYHAINPLLTAGWFMEMDEPYTSQSFMGDDFFSSRFYKEWVAPSGYHDAALTILAKSANRFAAIALPRLAGRGQFPADDLARMRLLAPHIRRAVTIADPARRQGAARRHAVGDVRPAGGRDRPGGQ